MSGPAGDPRMRRPVCRSSPPRPGPSRGPAWTSASPTRCRRSARTGALHVPFSRSRPALGADPAGSAGAGHLRGRQPLAGGGRASPREWLVRRGERRGRHDRVGTCRPAGQPRPVRPRRPRPLRIGGSDALPSFGRYVGQLEGGPRRSVGLSASAARTANAPDGPHGAPPQGGAQTYRLRRRERKRPMSSRVRSLWAYAQPMRSSTMKLTVPAPAAFR